MAYPCTSEDGNNSVLIISNLETGDTISLCPLCVRPWMVEMVRLTAEEDETVELPPVAEPLPGDTDAATEVIDQGDQGNQGDHVKWEGPAALDVYPPGDPRNEPDHPGNQPVTVTAKPPRKAAPRKRAAAKV